MSHFGTKTIAVIGAGDMGHGIAEVALLAGLKVHLVDVNKEILSRGVSRIHESLAKLVSKGKVEAALQEKIKSELLVPGEDLANAASAADLVIEAIPEVMELKKKVFALADKAAPKHAILASNTSTMSITEISKSTSRPDRVVGLHYFNPAVLMKAVEVTRGAETSNETFEDACKYVEGTGKMPFRVLKDSPGFIVNRIQAPASVLLHAILDEGIIPPMAVDATMKSLGMPMGPFETMDYTGLDVNLHVAEYYEKALHPDYRPGRALKALVASGRLGKKTGRGIFDWSKGKPEIDMSAGGGLIDPMDLVAVQANEAMKIVMDGVCLLKDINPAVINGYGAVAGPIALVSGMEPRELCERLDKLAEKYGKEIFRPCEGIVKGKYR